MKDELKIDNNDNYHNYPKCVLRANPPPLIMGHKSDAG